MKEKDETDLRIPEHKGAATNSQANSNASKRLQDDLNVWSVHGKHPEEDSGTSVIEQADNKAGKRACENPGAAPCDRLYLKRWPALADLPEDLSAFSLPQQGTLVQRVFGKIPNAATDYREICSSAVEGPNSGDDRPYFGAEEIRNDFLALSSIDGWVRAIHAYPSRAVDSAGRQTPIELQILEVRQEEIPPSCYLLYCASLLNMVKELGDETWLAQSSKPEWQEDRTYILPIEPPKPISQEDLEEAVTLLSGGKNKIRDAVFTNSFSAAAFYSLVHGGQQKEAVTLSSAQFNPVDLDTMLALCLPLKEEVLRKISFTTYFPSKRPDGEKLDKSWHLIGAAQWDIKTYTVEPLWHEFYAALREDRPESLPQIPLPCDEKIEQVPQTPKSSDPEILRIMNKSRLAFSIKKPDKGINRATQRIYEYLVSPDQYLNDLDLEQTDDYLFHDKVKEHCTLFEDWFKYTNFLLIQSKIKADILLKTECFHALAYFVLAENIVYKYDSQEKFEKVKSITLPLVGKIIRGTEDICSENRCPLFMSWRETEDYKKLDKLAKVIGQASLVNAVSQSCSIPLKDLRKKMIILFKGWVKNTNTREAKEAIKTAIMCRSRSYQTPPRYQPQCEPGKNRREEIIALGSAVE